MNSESNKSFEDVELTESDIFEATKEALSIIKKHSFGIAFPIVVTSSSLIGELWDYIDCWGQCNNPPPM